MEMSSNPVVDGAVKAATEVAIKWSTETVKAYVIRFKHREVAFVEDLATIQLALKQRKTSEYKIFCENIHDEKLRILFQLGLTLRGIETELEKCQKLRNTVIKKYGTEGLHIAQFVQNGIFTKYYSAFMERGLTPEQLKQAIWNLFQHIDHTNSFVQANDDESKIIDAIVSRINCYNPQTYSISGLRSVKGKVRSIASTVMKRIEGYSVEAYDTDLRVIVFLNRVEEITLGNKKIKIKC
jgi:hypothetical protein